MLNVDPQPQWVQRNLEALVGWLAHSGSTRIVLMTCLWLRPPTP
jgi:hypothetical protein